MFIIMIIMIIMDVIIIMNVMIIIIILIIIIIIISLLSSCLCQCVMKLFFFSTSSFFCSSFQSASGQNACLPCGPGSYTDVASTKVSCSICSPGN
jgi:hypothetical protein